jgi:hypothetical protein
MKPRETIPEELMEEMIQVYRKTLVEKASDELGLTAAHDFLQAKGCTVVRRTVKRNVSKIMGGSFKAAAVSNTFKIDETRTDDILKITNNIDYAMSILRKRLDQLNEGNSVTSALLPVLDSYARYIELQIKLASVSPKKAIATASVEVKEGAGRIILAQEIEHASD